MSTLILKKFDNVYWKVAGLIALCLILFMIIPDLSFAATSTAQVKSKLTSGETAIQSVITAIVVLMAIIAALIIIVKHLPSISDPHIKNEMWRGLSAVLAATIASAACIWILPWAYSLFT